MTNTSGKKCAALVINKDSCHDGWFTPDIDNEDDEEECATAHYDIPDVAELGDVCVYCPERAVTFSHSVDDGIACYRCRGCGHEWTQGGEAR